MPEVTHTTHPLSRLAEDVELLRANVRAFADSEIRPHVREMDERGEIPQSLIDKLFDLGVMAVEIPATFGGSGGHFFLSVVTVEELSRVDPSVAVLVDVQNTLVINALLRWGNNELQSRMLPRLSERTVGADALAEAGSGSDAVAMTTRATPTPEGSGDRRRIRRRGACRTWSHRWASPAECHTRAAHWNSITA